MKKSFLFFLGILCLLLTLSCSGSSSSSITSSDSPKIDDSEYQVVVYGGTPAGIMAAISAARSGLKVALLEPSTHIGGMLSGGLGNTDVGKSAVVGGMAREFFQRIGRHYNLDISWKFEPHVAEKILNDWLIEAGVSVFLSHRITSTRKAAGYISSLQTENGALFSAKVFVDASYEGDVLPRAGISYSYGREGQDTYGESLAGIQEPNKLSQSSVPVSGLDDLGETLPLVTSGNLGQAGSGDLKTQAYNFRLCMTKNKDNQVPFTKPADYNPKNYEILKKYLVSKSDKIILGDLIAIGTIPMGKYDINNNGPISTDYIGANWDYTEADYTLRDEIWKAHKNYILGFFHFLANDPSVPPKVKGYLTWWGLCKDEFIDNDHWPYQLYIREARRMIGEHVLTQHDLQTNLFKHDSIGYGSYGIDSHSIQRIVQADKTVLNEGGIEVAVKPYNIPYRSLVPKQAECKNLLVPVCLSASHIAFASIRMEPQYMIMGHAVGQAAYLAIRDRVPIQQIDIIELQNRLTSQGQVL